MPDSNDYEYYGPILRKRHQSFTNKVLNRLKTEDLTETINFMKDEDDPLHINNLLIRHIKELTTQEKIPSENYFRIITDQRLLVQYLVSLANNFDDKIRTIQENFSKSELEKEIYLIEADELQTKSMKERYFVAPYVLMKCILNTLGQTKIKKYEAKEEEINYVMNKIIAHQQKIVNSMPKTPQKNQEHLIHVPKMYIETDSFIDKELYLASRESLDLSDFLFIYN